MKLFLSLVAVVAIASCTPQSSGGSGTGETTNGDTLFGEALLTPDGNNTVTISSLDDWSCVGSYPNESGTVGQRFPLSCDNGATGNAVLTVNASDVGLEDQRAAVAFDLNNGQSGTVTFEINS